MQQTAVTQTTAANLFGLPLQGTQGGQNALFGNGLIFGGNGGLSFQTFLMMTPGQNLDALQNMSKGVTNSGVFGAGGNAALSPLLQLQAAAEAEGKPLWEQLRTNIQSMFMPKTATAISAPAAGDAALQGQTVTGDATQGISEDILFRFNAPLSLGRGLTAQMSQAATGKTAQAGDTTQKAAVIGVPLSTDMIQHLIMIAQGQGQGQLDNIDLQNMTPEGMAALSSQLNTTLDNMTLEQFNDFKKAAFADLAPFLTQAKVVDMGNGKIMKITQGPAFLSKDDDADAKGLDGMMIMLIPAQAQDKAASGGFSASLGAGGGDGGTGLQTGTQGGAAVQNALQQAMAQAAAAMDAENAGAQTAATAAGKTGTSIFSKMVSGLSGLNQQSTVHSALLGSSALNPAGQGTSAAHMLVFDNIFTPHTEGMHDPVIADQNLDAVIKADIQSPAFKANTLVHTRAAGYPHPTSQGVAEQISAMVSRTPQGDRQMRLQLDPPELGNVTIQIKFGKDNTVKAHLTVERPETLHLLQKDAASLEKALQDAGIDTNGSSLSFDLQQGDQGGDKGFDRNGNGNGHGGEAGEFETNAPAVIETQMTVFVDPVTGQQRVNMMV